MPDQVHEVGGVFAVVNRKGGVQADLFGILSQQPGADPRFRPRSMRPSSLRRCRP